MRPVSITTEFARDESGEGERSVVMLWGDGGHASVGASAERAVEDVGVAIVAVGFGFGFVFVFEEVANGEASKSNVLKEEGGL